MKELKEINKPCDEHHKLNNKPTTEIIAHTKISSTHDSLELSESSSTCCPNIIKKISENKVDNVNNCINVIDYKQNLLYFNKKSIKYFYYNDTIYFTPLKI